MKLWERFLAWKTERRWKDYETNFTCELCGKEVFDDAYFCPKCRKKLPFTAPYVCPICGRKTFFEAGVCTECKASVPIFEEARSPFVYEGDIARLVLKMKRGAGYLSVLFGREMLPLLTEFPKAELLVPVPTTAKKLRVRGFNPAGLLAEYLARHSRMEFCPTLLEEVGAREEQKGLSRVEREKNVHGRYRVTERKRCKGKRILVVDDVMTTGATANEIARILLAAGAECVYLMTAASTPLRGFDAD